MPIPQGFFKANGIFSFLIPDVNIRAPGIKKSRDDMRHAG